MKSFFRVAILALMLVTVALFSALTAMRLAIHGQEVSVPALLGMAPADAERAVAGLGLQIDIERQYYSPQIPKGKIVSQMPPAGTRVRRGWQVRVAQSLGPMRIAIPDVTGESERTAEFNIRRRGLDLASTATIEMPGIPADQVVAQSPPANASQVAAPKINLLLTVAPSSPVFVMPSFIGQGLGNASRTLQDSGFRLANVSVAPPPANPSSASQESTAALTASPSSEVPAQPTPASIIVSQTPAAGQKVALGTAVSFEVR
jgi:eukaryotic-like serine/threonine-protein kinase